MPLALNPSDRRRHGRSARRQLPRSAHADFNPKARRHDPLDLLRRSDRGRIPDLVTLKYERMAASPFGFFRGAAPVMAGDLSTVPHTGIINQICGDAHILNLGAFAGIDGRLLFDINDFDETIRGPFEWDIKRLAASLVLAGREIHAKNSSIEDAVLALLDGYRTAMHRFVELPVTALARYQVHRIDEVQPIAGILARAERATPLVSLDKLTEPAPTPPSHARPPNIASQQAKSRHHHDRRPSHPAQPESEPRRFRSDPPILTRLGEKEAAEVLASLGPYARTLQPERRHFLAQYRPLDVAFKVVGTGSVGLRDFCIYLEGNGPGDPIFLQIKEEAPSAYADYLPAPPARHQGHRVVDGARAMQLESDPFLGYTTIAHRDFLVRQLNDHKASLNVDAESKELRSAGLRAYADLSGELLARGHARSGDPISLSAYIGKSDRFDAAVARFATAYADQTERDWKQLKNFLRKSAPSETQTSPAKPSSHSAAKLAAKSAGQKPSAKISRRSSRRPSR